MGKKWYADSVESYLFQVLAAFAMAVGGLLAAMAVPSGRLMILVSLVSFVSSFMFWALHITPRMRSRLALFWRRGDGSLKMRLFTASLILTVSWVGLVSTFCLGVNSSGLS